MDYPLVSIIIPCYNHEKYVSQTLDSILEDSYPNKEVIIIDDGSKDNSKSIIENWIKDNKEKIKILFKYRSNKGICATLNELVKNANGKYLVPIASDDILYNNTISERVELFQKKPQYNVIVSDALVINPMKKVIMQSSIENYNQGDKKDLQTPEGIIMSALTNPSISGATAMIDKSIYEKIGLYPEQLKAEDWWFYQRAAFLKVILYYDKKVSLYRIHEENISGKSSKAKISLVITIIKTYLINFRFYKGFNYKLIISKQLVKYVTILIKLTIKKYVIASIY